VGSSDQQVIGQRFGKLVVVAKAWSDRWLCRCDCGNEKAIRLVYLKKNMTKSCGCLRAKHGLSHLPEFNVWNMMQQRCNNPNYNRYLDYGGRGIKVCERWLGPKGFEHFISDLGRRPSPQHKLERIDNDGDYAPSNCCWVTQAEQSRNRRNNKWVTYNGETLVVKDWATKLGMDVMTLKYRLKHWGLERAMTTPLAPNSRRK